MADEPRRSGRATKGQHTKDREPSEEVPPSKVKGKKGRAGKRQNEAEEAADDEDNAYIRCVCGLYEEEEDVPRAMICCDKCTAWQHNDCMGLDEDYAPEEYYCEQCKPEDHKELLTAISKGEKPWEEVAQRRQAAIEAEKTKKGKRGRKSGARLSEAVSRGSQDVEDGTPVRGGQKRKMDESPADVKGTKKARASETPVELKNGGRKSSAARADVGQGPVATTLNELNNANRKSVANNLIKAFVDHTKAAVKQGRYVLPAGLTTEKNGEQLALRIEHAMYAIQCRGAGEPNEAYKAQMRTILFNLKKNADLRDRVLEGDVSPHKLASMDAAEMASDEQQRKDAAIKQELEKQHTIVQDEGPRIRRTHKGDEYVGEYQQVAAESTTSHAPVRRGSVTAQDGEAVKSPEVMSPAEPVSRPSTGKQQSKSRPAVDTKRKSSTNFNIDNVWSNVQGSPEASQQRFPELRGQSPGVHEHKGPGAAQDADIDALLKDEDAESPPYSPKDYADGDGIIWRGAVDGGSLGRFECAAKYAAGCPVEDLHMTYEDLIPATIHIGGRIDPVKADEYLCGLQYSQSSDVVVVSIARPEHDQKQFDKLFSYFKSRTRYGVGSPHRNLAIKDVYLMPLEVGDPLPGLLQLLESKINNPVTERMLLVPFVVKNTELPHNLASKDQAAVAPPTPIQQTPITPHDGTPYDYQQNLSHLPYQQPANGMPGYGPQPPYPPSASNQYGTPTPSFPPQQQQQSRAAISAQQILGPDLAQTPAVVQLVQQAPNAGVDEMNVIKECIHENPMAAQDLTVLRSMLEKRYDGSPVSGPGPELGSGQGQEGAVRDAAS